ncbi:Isotrichodermin C-15 hydroxylase 20, partial [Colletotrichum chlorophyti]
LFWTFASLSIYYLWFGPLSHVPGPLLAKISPVSEQYEVLWLARATWRRRFNFDVRKLHDYYGPVVQLSPNEVSFASVAAQKTIHGQFGSHKRPTTKAQTLESLMGEIVWPAKNLLTTSDPDEHRQLRTSLQPAFTQKAMLAQEKIHQHHTDLLLSNIKRESLKNGGSVNLTEHVSRTIWDVVGDLSFGYPLSKTQFASFASNTDAVATDNFEILKRMFCSLGPMIEVIQWGFSLPFIGLALQQAICLIPRIFRLPINIVDSPKCKDDHDYFCRDICDIKTGRVDFYTAIRDCAEKGISMSDAEIHSNATLLVMVGYDTTATSLSAIIHNLLRHPSYLSALRDELHANYTSTSEMTATSLARLPLLNGCIQETLRLLPPANGKGTNRMSLGTEIDGIYIPKGVNVSADMYTIQRSPLYWANPDSFCPERWFANGPGTPFENDNRSAHCPFLLGPRLCIGRAVAMQSMRLVLAKLVFSFEMQASDPSFRWEDDVKNSYLWIDYQVMANINELKG